MSTDGSDFSLFSYDKPRGVRRFFARPRVDAYAVLLGLTLVGLAAMAWGYISSLKPVELIVNQHALTVYSNQKTVGGVLNDAAISLAPEDVTFPSLDAPVPDNQPISVRFAYPIQIEADGDTILRRTQSKTVGEALGEANVLIKPGDRVLVDGRLAQPSSPLGDPQQVAALSEPPQISISVQRAVPIQVDDNGALTTLYTTAPTLGEALRQAGLVVFLGDSVRPDLGTQVEPGWEVYIRRSRPASISVDGKTIHTRTLSDTIAGLLSQEGIQLQGKDYTVPPSTNRVTDGVGVQVVRVRENIITESEQIPFETVWQPDSSMEIDQRRLVQTGVAGVKKRQIRIVYENGREVRRSLDKEWIAAAPVTQMYSYGTKIVKRDLTLPDGTTITYWRKIRVLATSYTAATSGKPRTHPEFGRTYLGWQAGTGIVAVDPRVINLRSKMYVPGYGLGTAGDTGGRIKGRRIDLGYDENNLILWYQWVDVYMLDPVPPADQIHYIIPDSPVERTTTTR